MARRVVARPGEVHVSLTDILTVILVVVLIGALPVYPYSRGWGYGPSGVLGVILLVILLLVVMGRL